MALPLMVTLVPMVACYVSEALYWAKERARRPRRAALRAVIDAVQFEERKTHRRVTSLSEVASLPEELRAKMTLDDRRMVCDPEGMCFRLGPFDPDAGMR
ncbi:MAG: hypothetical protein U0228_36325 [Myxococcaceae bacterium]